MFKLSQFLSLATLAVSVGAMAFVAAALVPQWKSMEPGAFVVAYKSYEPHAKSFLIPLGMFTLAVSLLAGALKFYAGGDGALLAVVAALLVIVWTALYPLYFAGADALFTSGAADSRIVQAELARFGIWQWLRVGLLAAATVLQALSMAQE